MEGPISYLRKKNSIKGRRNSHMKKDCRREADQGVTCKNMVTTGLMGSIQLGLEHVIGSQGSHSSTSSNRNRDVLLNDFEASETISFPRNGGKKTPSHSYRGFQFRSYASFAFNNFRQIYNIDASLYLASLCSLPMKELSSHEGSSSILYKTSDDNFVCKNVYHKEAKYLQTILPGYWMNLKQNPDTYLPKFFGLYRYTCNTKNIRLVVMNNLIPSHVRIDHTFDLKGSVFNRTASEKENKKERPVYKDLDFLEMYPQGIRLDAETCRKLINSIERDCRVLESFNIMNYSLLLSIHNVEHKANQESIGPKGDQPDKACAPIISPFEQNLPTNERLGQSTMVNNSRVPILGKNEWGEDLLLFVGIIDILQSFDLGKKLEHSMKSMVHDNIGISTHNPGYYSRRFVRFITEKVLLPNMETNFANRLGSRRRKNSDAYLPLAARLNSNNTENIDKRGNIPDVRCTKVRDHCDNKEA